MMRENLPGVQFPLFSDAAPSALDLVSRLLREVVRRFPTEFASLRLPQQQPLSKTALADVLVDFESLRGTSSRRAEIAAFATDLVQKWFSFNSDSGRQSLEEAFTRESQPLPILVQSHGGTKVASALAMKFRGQDYAGYDETLNLLSELLADSLITQEAHETLAWAATLISEGRTSSYLQGRKFVLLGGTAELSPLSHLLADGADVLTTHSSLESLQGRLGAELTDSKCPGRLFYFRDGLDLLLSPVALAQTVIDSFAQGQPVDLVLLAYKGGEGREWRLAAAMDGIVRRVRAAGLLRSVTYYLSPSMTTQISGTTAKVSLSRFEHDYSLFKRSLNLLFSNSLFKGNIAVRNNRFWTRSILPAQGASYAAANLFGKICAAEMYCAESQLAGSTLAVSANVAPVTSTTSTKTPVTRSALTQISQFGIEVFDPATSRTLMYLLMLYDLLHRAPACENLFARQVHGGVFTSPWALDTAMRMAYGMGLVRGGRL